MLRPIMPIVRSAHTAATLMALLLQKLGEVSLPSEGGRGGGSRKVALGRDV